MKTQDKSKVIYLRILNKNAELNFTTHFDFSVGFTDPKRHFETMIGNVIDIFMNTVSTKLHQLSIKNLLEKLKFGQLPVRGSQTREIEYVNHVFFHVTSFAS